MTVSERTGGIRAFLVERYLPVYPIYLTLWVVAVESMTAVVTDSAGPWHPTWDTALKALALVAAGAFLRMVDDQKDLDYDRLFEMAVETGTAVEIDGAPSHLDLDSALARRAVAAGATVTIDSDCHRSEMLGRQMELGLMTARRGWVEPRHVLNARPLADLRSAIAAKRGSR